MVGRIFVFLLLLKSFSLGAAIIVEPFYGMTLWGVANSYIRETTTVLEGYRPVIRSLAYEAEFDIDDSFTYGLKLGYMFKYLAIGLEYSLGSFQWELLSPVRSTRLYGPYNMKFFGGYLSFVIPKQPVRFFYTHYFDVEFEYGEGKNDDKGNGRSFGVSYLGIKRVYINLEYRLLDMSSSGFTEEELPNVDNKTKCKEIVISVSIPFIIGKE